MVDEKKKILVVEDDDDMLRLLRRRLKTEGFEVVAAMDGVACMREVRNEHPDLVILDLGLPAGDGFKILERLQHSLRMGDVPVLVFTGRQGASIRAQALEAGAAAVLSKTDQGGELLPTVWALLAGDSAPQEFGRSV